MQAARDRADQHGIFFVVWPEEKSQESQATLPSPQHPQDINSSSSLMETAASSSSSQDTSTASRDASTSRRYTDSISPPMQSPESEYLYLSSKQHAPSPAAVDPLKPYSPMQPFRAGTTGHQMIALPAPAIVSLAAESQQVLLATDQPNSIISNHPPEQRDHSILFSPAHKQLLQMNGPLLTGVPTVPQRQDVENLRKIGNKKAKYTETSI